MTAPAPELGADPDHVLADVLGLPQERIIELRTTERSDSSSSRAKLGGVAATAGTEGRES